MAQSGKLVGKKVERYRFQQLIGSGSSGEVYRAHDVRLRRDVAIKVFDPELIKNPGVLERFVKEARIQARLEHANIIPIYDLIEQRRQLFMVLRFVQGDNLRQLIERRGRALTPQEAMTYFRQVLDAVGFAHSKGVIHQDLKPHNVQVTPAGEALVLDFGVARLVGERRERGEKLAGTPAYISPEQVEGRYTDSRSDIYSLGMSLYQITTGHHPFENAKDLDQILRWQVDREPLPPTTFNPDLPAPFAMAVLKAIAKQPRDRFRSCRELLEALEAGLATGAEAPEGARPDVRWHPRATLMLPARVRFGGQQDREDVGGGWIPARTIDLSVGGVALRVKADVGEGEKARIEVFLPSPGATQVIQAAAVVVRAGQPDDDGFADVGLRFTDLSDADREFIGTAVREALVMGPSMSRTHRSA